jgi:hypothetical protein
MPQVEFPKDSKGKYRAEVKIPVSAHQTRGALKQVQLMIHRYLDNRPSNEYNITHEDDHCSFWIPINPRAPLDALKRTNTLMRSLEGIVDDIEVDYDKLKALH